MGLKQSARTWEMFSKNAAVRDAEKARMELIKDIHLKLLQYR